MYAKKGATVSLESFNSLTGILSGPVDLDEFNLSSSLIRGSTTNQNFFGCFNGVMFIFCQLLGHGATNTKILFSKLPLLWLPSLITPYGEKWTHL